MSEIGTGATVYLPMLSMGPKASPNGPSALWVYGTVLGFDRTIPELGNQPLGFSGTGEEPLASVRWNSGPELAPVLAP